MIDKIRKKESISPAQQYRRRQSYFMAALCALLYFTSYFTRKSFSAVKMGIPGDVLTDIEMGQIGSALFFAYGAGQIVSGILADRKKPEYLIYLGLVITILCNFCFPFLTVPLLQILLWGLNGFAQALFWPPILKLFCTTCDRKYYATACVICTVGGYTASVAIYVLASRIIALGNFRLIFYIAAAVATVTLILLRILFPRAGIRDGSVEAVILPSDIAKEKKTAGSFGTFFILSGLFCACLSMVMMGFMRDGIDEWLPKYMMDVFDFGGDSATLLVVVLSLFAIFCAQISSRLYNKVFRGNEIALALITAGIGAVGAFILFLIYDKGSVPAVLLFLLLSGGSHIINVCLTCYFPLRYESQGRMSTVAGIVNASVYVGSTIATVLIPVLYSSIGWGFTLLTFSGIYGLAALSLLCLQSFCHKKKQ